MTDKVIKELPNNGFAPSNESIAKHLREQADWIEEGEPVRNVYMVIETMDGRINRQVMGHTCDLARCMGVLSMAIVRGSIGEE